jgi:uncharacterized protein
MQRAFRILSNPKRLQNGNNHSAVFFCSFFIQTIHGFHSYWLHSWKSIKGKKINAKWNREHIHFDVSKPLQDVTCPVLAITGTKDVNVKVSDLEKIKRLVQGECETHIIQDMTHMLRKTDVEYSFSKIMNNNKKSLKQPIDSELKEIMIAWLRNWKNRQVKTENAEMLVK